MLLHGIKVSNYIFRGITPSFLCFDYLLNGSQLLTLLHSEWPKLYRVLAILSAIGLKKRPHFERVSLYREDRNICKKKGKKSCVLTPL